MTGFIHHRTGAVNIDHIATVTRGEPKFWDIRAKDGKLLTAKASDVNITIMEMVPGDRCELMGINLDSKAHPRSYYADPIIAFARMALGDVRPITLSRLRPDNGLHPYVFRRKGSTLVWRTDGGSYTTADEWLIDLQERFDAERKVSVP